MSSAPERSERLGDLSNLALLDLDGTALCGDEWPGLRGEASLGDAERERAPLADTAFEGADAAPLRGESDRKDRDLGCLRKFSSCGGGPDEGDALPTRR